MYVDVTAHLPSMVEYVSISSGVTEGSSNTCKQITCMHVATELKIVRHMHLFCFCFTGATTSLISSTREPMVTTGLSSPGKIALQAVISDPF